MTHAIYDFAAIRKETKAFPEDRPQNVVKPAEGDKVTEHLIFDPYADGAFPADYSCFRTVGYYQQYAAEVWDHFRRVQAAKSER